MKKYGIWLGLGWMAAALAAGESGKPEGRYSLKLACGQDRLLLGEEVECALEVKGFSLPSPGTGKLSERLSLAFRSGPAAQGRAKGFLYPFSFRPDKAGAMTLGPFELELEGEKLTSNRLLLWVIEPPAADVPLAVRASKSEVAVGEEFDLVLVERVANEDEEPGITRSRTPPARVALVGSRALEIRGGSRTTRVSDDGVEHVTFYQAVAREPGRLVVGRGFLAGLEPDEEVPELVIEVYGPD